MPHSLIRIVVALSTLSLAACVVPDGATPSAEYTLDLASQFMHRGMVQNERGVAQPGLTVDVPTKNDGALSVSSWGNLDLSNDTGNAWFPDGHEGRFSQIDFVGSYSETYKGWDTVAGVHNYNLPNGLEFPFGQRGATTELFASLGRLLPGDVYAMGRLHVDVDEAEGVYAHGSVARAFDLSDRVLLNLSLGLGWNDGNHALWAYGLDEAGFADLVGSARVNYIATSRTMLHFTLSGSTIVDSTQSDWIESLGIDPDNVWVSTGVTWNL